MPTPPKPMNPRRPYDNELVEGYLESDDAFLRNNNDLAVWYLEHDTEVRAALRGAPAWIEFTGVVRAESIATGVWWIKIAGEDTPMAATYDPRTLRFNAVGPTGHGEINVCAVTHVMALHVPGAPA